MAVKANKIMIVGCGPGSRDLLTAAGQREIEAAGVLIGASRLLDLCPEATAERIPVGKDMEAIMQVIADRREKGRVAILVTGDPGLYSLAASVVQRFGREACEIVPGISALQTAFARLGIGWEEARVISTHAAEPDLCPEELCRYAKIAILGGDRELVARLAPLLKYFLDRGYRIFAGEDLTLPEELFYEIGSDRLEGRCVSTRTILLIVRGDIL